MKKNEVNAWIEYHKSLFPEWKYSRADSPEAKKIAFLAISKALAKVELADATEASDRMLAGTVNHPFRDEQHLAEIVKAAAAIRSQRWAESHPRVDGQETVACPLCFDSGFVECWRGDLIHKMAVACSCPRGEGPAGKWAGVVGRPAMAQRYDPLKCYRVGDTSDYWLGIRAQVEADIAAQVGQQIQEAAGF